MFLDILNENQRELVPVLQHFSKSFFLVGGTAIALQIGHRRSIDFDLFTNKPLQRVRIKRLLNESPFPVQRLLYEDKDQMHLIIHDVKLTFFNFPYTIKGTVSFSGNLKMPDLLDLGSMKVFALGGRAKWKDYVDLYFLLKNYFPLQDLVDRAKHNFKGGFNTKLIKAQLAYFEDIDFAEAIEFLPGQAVDEAEVKQFLTNIAIS